MEVGDRGNVGGTWFYDKLQEVGSPTIPGTAFPMGNPRMFVYYEKDRTILSNVALGNNGRITTGWYTQLQDLSPQVTPSARAFFHMLVVCCAETCLCAVGV